MADGSLSQFKATLARKLERKQKRQGKFDKKLNYKNSDSKPEFDFPKLSESELDNVKSDIRKKLKSDNKKLIVSTTIFVIIILTIIYLIQS